MLHLIQVFLAVLHRVPTYATLGDKVMYYDITTSMTHDVTLFVVENSTGDED